MAKARSGFPLEANRFWVPVSTSARDAQGILAPAMSGIHVEGRKSDGFAGSAGFSPDRGRCACREGWTLKKGPIGVSTGGGAGCALNAKGSNLFGPSTLGWREALRTVAVGRSAGIRFAGSLSTNRLAERGSGVCLVARKGGIGTCEPGTMLADCRTAVGCIG